MIPGLLSILLHSCEIKSVSGLGTRISPLRLGKTGYWTYMCTFVAFAAFILSTWGKIGYFCAL